MKQWKKFQAWKLSNQMNRSEYIDIIFRVFHWPYLKNYVLLTANTFFITETFNV